MKKQIIYCLSLVIFTASGCAKKEVIKPETSVLPPTPATQPEKAVSTEKASQGISPESTVNSDEIPSVNPNSAPTVKPVDAGNLGTAAAENGGAFDSIYFDYDSHLISFESRNRLKKTADLLRMAPKKKLVVEGHCDERGSDDYNMALGQKRAHAAVEYLRFLGIDPSRVSPISYGEEKPAVQGHDDAAWAKNRRDEFHWQ